MAEAGDGFEMAVEKCRRMLNDAQSVLDAVPEERDFVDRKVEKYVSEAKELWSDIFCQRAGEAEKLKREADELFLGAFMREFPVGSWVKVVKPKGEFPFRFFMVVALDGVANSISGFEVWVGSDRASFTSDFLSSGDMGSWFFHSSWGEVERVLAHAVKDSAGGFLKRRGAQKK